jgi:iron complex transport system permease protein
VKKKLLLLTLFVPIAWLFGLLVGSSAVSLADLAAAIAGSKTPDAQNALAVVIDLRLPLVAQAFLCGGLLALAGAVLQAVLRNVLAEPFVLGVSSGSALGIVLAAAFGLGSGFWLRSGFAFLLGAGVAVLVLLLASRSRRGLAPGELILVGVVANAFCSAMTMLVQSLLSPFELQASIGTLMGGFSLLPWEVILPVTGLGLLIGGTLLLFAGRLDLLSLGREQARPLGLHDSRAIVWFVLGASLATALAVSLAGILGFVGLIAPHTVRLLGLRRHACLLPGAFLAGGSFLVIADTLARSLLPSGGLPVGAITALLGAPLFLHLLLFHKGGRRAEN